MKLTFFLVFLLPLSAEETHPTTQSTISCYLETFSLPLPEASALIRQGLDDPKLYRSCLSILASGQAIQESLTVLRGRSGGSVTNEAVLQTIYPREYEPAERPNSVLGGFAPQQPSALLVTPATPTSFKTRNLGLSTECRFTFDDDSDWIRIHLVSERTRHVGKSTHGQGQNTTEMPEIESQRHRTGIDLTPGRPQLIGTFNRAPSDDPTAAPRVYFSFVTATLVDI